MYGERESSLEGRLRRPEGGREIHNTPLMPYDKKKEEGLAGRRKGKIYPAYSSGKK